MDSYHVYRKLLEEFGRQDWWIPTYADTRLEVIVGAILVQRTRWENVEKAIKNLKRENLLDVNLLASANLKSIASLIQPSGFYKQKAKGIVNLCKYFVGKYGGSLDSFFRESCKQIRKELLEKRGIGPETADLILLYAGDKFELPISAYTKRIFGRLGVRKSSYGKYQKYLMNSLPRELRVYKEFHALLVKLGKTYCKKREPECHPCPLRDECNSAHC